MSGAFAWLSAAALSDVGRKRKNNEDAYGAFPDAGIWCVSDGMGGGDDGEIASSAVVRTVSGAVAALAAPEGSGRAAAETAAAVSAALSAASGWIFARTRRNGLRTCGATFAGVAFDATAPSSAIAMHAGDSRVYRIRGRSIEQITRDHSAAELVGVKDENELNPALRGVILRAVGVEKTVQTEITPFDVAEGDWIVICSDGLSKMIPDKSIRKIVASAKGDSEAAAGNLVSAANEAGGTDNITVVAIRAGALPQPLPPAPPAPLDFQGSSGSEFDSDTAETTAGTETVGDAETAVDVSGFQERTAAAPCSAPRDDSVPDMRTLILERGARSRRRRMIPVSLFKMSLCASLLFLAAAVVFAFAKQRRPAATAESPSGAETVPPAPGPSAKAHPPPPERRPAPPPARPAPQPSAIPAPSASVAESPASPAKADAASTPSPTAAKKLRNFVQGDAGLAFLAKGARYGAGDEEYAECIFVNLKWDCLGKHPELRGKLAAPAEQEAWECIVSPVSKGKTSDEYAAATLIVKALKKDIAKIGAGGRR